MLKPFLVSTADITLGQAATLLEKSVEAGAEAYEGTSWGS